MDTGGETRALVEREFLPARMLNEFAYCPRLCYLEWVQGEFADGAGTIRSWVVRDGGPIQVTSDAREAGKVSGGEQDP
jgi:CRISPR/Cas system-associated exonuclease Cas4 (RecB family)